MAYVVEPPSVKVFAIMHMVFAGIGILTAAWGLIVAFIGNPFVRLLPEGAAMDAQIQTQLAMEKRLMPMTLTSSGLSLLVALLMIYAGIRMLRKRRNGLKWSNIYAWTSLTCKAINVVLIFGIMLPAIKSMGQGMMPGGATMPHSAETAMLAAAIGGAVLAVIISCVYPALSLILLNREATRNWFTNRPK